MSDRDLQSKLARDIRQRLLTDHWGGWQGLDPQFFDRLCDRMAEVAIDSLGDPRTGILGEDLEQVLEIPGLHAECADIQDYHAVEDALEKCMGSLADVEERERKLLTGRVSALGGIRV